MTAKKPFHLIPAFLIVASALTIAGCSKSDTSDSAHEEQSTSLVNDLTDKTEQATQDATALISETADSVTDAASNAATDLEAAGTKAVESATSAVKESAASASATAATATKTATEKAASVTASAKTSVSDAAAKVAETGSSAVKAVTEKAAETKTAISNKVAALAPSSSGSQVEMLELAKKSGCLSCHSIEKKIVGPAWRDVAAKYRGMSDAKTNIIHSITNGSTGKWGTFAMPANSPRVSDENIATLAGFVLSLE